MGRAAAAASAAVSTAQGQVAAAGGMWEGCRWEEGLEMWAEGGGGLGHSQSCLPGSPSCHGRGRTTLLPGGWQREESERITCSPSFVAGAVQGAWHRLLPALLPCAGVQCLAHALLRGHALHTAHSCCLGCSWWWLCCLCCCFQLHEQVHRQVMVWGQAAQVVVALHRLNASVQRHLRLVRKTHEPLQRGIVGHGAVLYDAQTAGQGYGR